MSLYYQDEFVELYHGNCITEHREWLDADVLVTDPPYGVNNHMNHKRQIAGDRDTSIRDAALEAWGDRSAITFGKWTVQRPAGVKARLIWDKTPCGFMGDLKMPWGSAEEEIYIHGSGFIGKREANILRVPTIMSGDADRPDHPTPKPVGLMELLIRKCPPGAIADPFAGSGATLIAAKNLRRQAVGVELEERYCEIIAKRLAQDVLDIFGGKS
jgi:DNA modification methylase